VAQPSTHKLLTVQCISDTSCQQLFGDHYHFNCIQWHCYLGQIAAHFCICIS